MTDLTLDGPGFSLALTRTVAAPRGLVWRCWTQPDLLKQWYCPQPWTVPEAVFDLRPGGRMNMTMAGPEGERMDLQGVFLAIETERRLVFTDAYTEDFWPSPQSFMTGTVELSDTPDGETQMIWTARHSSEEAREQHLAMGFETGWPTAAAQLNALAMSLHQKGAA